MHNWTFPHHDNLQPVTHLQLQLQLLLLLPGLGLGAELGAGLGAGAALRGEPRLHPRPRRLLRLLLRPGGGSLLLKPHFPDKPDNKIFLDSSVWII